MVYHGSDENLTNHMSWLCLLAAAFLIGGFYPITQVYQHESDKNDNVITVSMLLGKKGTFIFCAAMYTIAIYILWLYYNSHELYKPFFCIINLFLTGGRIFYAMVFKSVERR